MSSHFSLIVLAVDVTCIGANELATTFVGIFYILISEVVDS